MRILESTTGRHCDARCYNAKGKVCRCICEGINHGLGLEKAKGQMERLINAIIESNEGGKNEKS